MTGISPSRTARPGSLTRFRAMFVKEFIQLRRDRVTFATMIMIPLLQIILFGFAINTTPTNLPAAVLMQEHNDITRSVLAALRNTSYFRFVVEAASEEELDHLIRSGDVLFAVEIPAGFERAIRRGDKAAILVVADATDPVASGTALAALEGTIERSLERDRVIPPDREDVQPFEFRQHRRYNPAGVTRLNIVPGLLGTILTMTMLVFTALSVTREVERGTMESLLAMPISPLELMLGKITPYIFAGAIQAAIIFACGWFIFSVPLEGDPLLLIGLTLLFITTNLSIGYSFSTVAGNQLQAIQMTFMFFLPSILLSGFMFPFAGMPRWAQWIGEALPMTHYLRIVRGIMLKGAGMPDVYREAGALLFLTLIAMTIAVTRFRRTLD
ncbi:MAG: ABC transporter permease [Flavobacteriaceae bacterium]